MRKLFFVIAGICLCVLLSVPALQAEDISAAIGAPAPVFAAQDPCSGFGARTQSSPAAGGSTTLSDPNCPGPRYTFMDPITISATANTGFTFTGWSGAFCPMPCVNTNTSPCIFNMPASLVLCIANFQ